MSTFEEVLEHYGVKGMHWGTRKGSTSGTAGEKPRETSADAAKASELKSKAKKKGPQSLSNDEMRTLIQRMQLDSQFSQLNAKQKNKGLQMVQEILTNNGKQLVNEAVKSGMKAGAKLAFEAAMKK